VLREFNNLLAVGACGGVVAAAEAVTIPLLRRAATSFFCGHARLSWMVAGSIVSSRTQITEPQKRTPCSEDHRLRR